MLDGYYRPNVIWERIISPLVNSLFQVEDENVNKFDSYGNE